MTRKTTPPALSQDLIDDLMTIERRIKDNGELVRRLRGERRRLFHPGHLYVVEFDESVVKVGRAENADARLANHAKAGLVRRSWISEHHIGTNKTEKQVIAFCNEHGTLHGGREYFRGIAFPVVCAYASLTVQVAQLDASVETMLTGADGDLDANALDAYRRATKED